MHLVFVLHNLHTNIADSVRLTQLRKSCEIPLISKIYFNVIQIKLLINTYM